MKFALRISNNMNNLRWMIFVLLLSACGKSNISSSIIPTAKFDAAGIESINVKISRGALSVINSENDQILVNGRIIGSDTSGYSIEIQDDILSIQFKDEEMGFFFRDQLEEGNSLNLAIPSQVPLAIEIFDGSVEIDGDYAFMDIDSVSADIQADGMTGWIRLRSGRGDISVSKGSGEFHLLGEHGKIFIEGVNGRIEASTILGDIAYIGMPGVDDDLNFEVDHGSIYLTILQGASMRYYLQTANGHVLCLMPNVILGPNSCGGSVGEGAGMLKARSVSGIIEIRSQP
jgi:hypothetical protein